MIDRSKVKYGTGKPGSGGLEGLTEDKAKAEADAVYEQTKRKAADKLWDAKIKAGSTSGTIQLNSPVSSALKKVTQ